MSFSHCAVYANTAAASHKTKVAKTTACMLASASVASRKNVGSTGAATAAFVVVRMPPTKTTSMKTTTTIETTKSLLSPQLLSTKSSSTKSSLTRSSSPSSLSSSTTSSSLSFPYHQLLPKRKNRIRSSARSWLASRTTLPWLGDHSTAFTTSSLSMSMSSSSSYSYRSTHWSQRLYSSSTPDDEINDDDKSSTRSTNSAKEGRSSQGGKTSGVSSKLKDSSAVSQSRVSFSMPANSPDDGATATVGAEATRQGTGSKNLKDPRGTISRGGGGGSASSASTNDSKSPWEALGLWPELANVIQNQYALEAPTSVQSSVIPSLLQDPMPSTLFVAATGSGKTLAYTLPLLQQLKQSELAGNYTVLRRQPKRPRALILAPTRELATQITAVVKACCHVMKLSSQLIVGGGAGEWSLQKVQLNRPIDIVIATPGRLLQHIEQQTIQLSSNMLDYVVLDEMDTLLEQGFAKELRNILYPLLYRKRPKEMNDVEKEYFGKDKAPTLIMTSATLTQAVLKMMGTETKKQHEQSINAKKLFVKVQPLDDQQQQQQSQETDSSSSSSSSSHGGLLLPHNIQVLKGAGLHKIVPRLQQVFVDVGSNDKLSLLVDLMSQRNSRGGTLGKSSSRAGSRPQGGGGGVGGQALTMIFCNTAPSCRAVQYALSEVGIDSMAYHGELNSNMRSENLRRFRLAGTGGGGGSNNSASPSFYANQDQKNELKNKKKEKKNIYKHRPDDEDDDNDDEDNNEEEYHDVLYGGEGSDEDDDDDDDDEDIYDDDDDNESMAAKKESKKKQLGDDKKKEFNIMKSQLFTDDNALVDGNGKRFPTVLVCTDLAARGLDVPHVDHVIMFDFPLNSMDYLHRSGRTARGTSALGRVTALVTKRDKVLAMAIERAVQNGEPLDGLSGRKSDYFLTPPSMSSSSYSSSSSSGGSRRRSSGTGGTGTGGGTLLRNKKNKVSSLQTRRYSTTKTRGSDERGSSSKNSNNNNSVSGPRTGEQTGNRRRSFQ